MSAFSKVRDLRAQVKEMDKAVAEATEGVAHHRGGREVAVAAVAVHAVTHGPDAAVSVKSTSEVTERKKGPVWPGAYVAGTMR